MVRAGGQVSVFGGSQDRVVTEDPLYFEQVDARFDQMGGITVAKGCIPISDSSPTPSI